jgi:hypothetical protein
VSNFLLLCALNSSRVAQILDTETGVRYPFVFPKSGGALDTAIQRDGWIAIQPGYDVYAVPDHQPTRRTPLTTAWSISAAADQRFIIARAKSERGSMQTVQLLSIDGVERQITGELTNVVGDLFDGTLVTYDALVDWNGTKHPLPAKGSALGVISGQMILMSDRNRVSLVDGGTGGEIASVGFGGNLYSLASNPSGSSLATSSGPATLVATETSLKIYEDLGSSWVSPIWINDDELLISGDQHVLLKVVSSEQTTIESVGKRHRERTSPVVSIFTNLISSLSQVLAYPANRQANHSTNRTRRSMPLALDSAWRAFHAPLHSRL